MWRAPLSTQRALPTTRKRLWSTSPRPDAKKSWWCCASSSQVASAPTSAARSSSCSRHRRIEFRTFIFEGYENTGINKRLPVSERCCAKEWQKEKKSKSFVCCFHSLLLNFWEKAKMLREYCWNFEKFPVKFFFAWKLNQFFAAFNFWNNKEWPWVFMEKKWFSISKKIE